MISKSTLKYVRKEASLTLIKWVGVEARVRGHDVTKRIVGFSCFIADLGKTHDVKSRGWGWGV